MNEQFWNENYILNSQKINLSAKQKVDVLLTEYDKAQDSAQHHDTLVWTVSSLNWIGSAVLIVLGYLQAGIFTTKPSTKNYYINLLIFIL